MIDDYITFQSHVIYVLKIFYNFLHLEKKSKVFPQFQNPSSKHTFVCCLCCLFNQIRLGTHKYSSIVSFEMKDDISPVNPLEDKFLVAFPNIT